MPHKLIGYLIPDNIDGYDAEDFICVQLMIPNERLYREALLGQLHELGYWKTWEHRKPNDATDTRAAQVAQFFQDNVLGTITVSDGPCDDCDGDESDDAPYWADADALSDAGTAGNWEYIGDWIVTGFLATAFSPLAALVYRTVVPRARLAFKTHDLGMLADVFIDGILAVTVPTLSSTPGVTEKIIADIDLVQFAADHSLPVGERLIRIVPRAA